MESMYTASLSNIILFSKYTRASQE